MSTSSQLRLMRDLYRMEMDPPAGVSACPSDDNLYLWNAVIMGPLGTPYENGVFKLILQFSQNYPATPALVRFTSKMFHPNIFSDGVVCKNTIAKIWNPEFDVAAILVCLQALLGEPYPDLPADPIAALIYLQDKRMYYNLVKECVELSLAKL
ncbi:ubiquitin-conjugating enzyme E2-17 kDa [Halyomorpha halys]|uniref:ubiquitin-conjugating enzyme E2-17 kDa n=1 Tax=Halyomorpha halys TaxID=286706 RepID=UPI0006D4F52C|nr:ubiquitin-conjugating enzyme E2-17 kDa-like [Halyomorpha halys]